MVTATRLGNITISDQDGRGKGQQKEICSSFPLGPYHSVTAAEHNINLPTTDIKMKHEMRVLHNPSTFHP